MAEDVVQVIFRARDELSGELRKIDMSVGQLLGSLGRFALPAGVVVGALSAIGTAAFALTKSVADAGDALDKMSIRLGVAVEDLSALKLAADLNDASLQELAQAFRFLSTNLSDAIQKSGDARNVMQALGFSVADLRRGQQDPVAFLEEFARRLFEIPNATQRTEAAVAVLGRSAQGLLPLLQDIAERGIAGIREESDRLGVTWSSDMARASQVFNDQLTRLEAQLGAVAREVAGPVMQAFIAFFDLLGLGAQTPIAQSLDAIDQKIQHIRDRLGGAFGFSLREGFFGPATGAEAERLQAALDSLLKVREQLTSPPPSGTRQFILPDKEAAEAAEKAKKAIDAVTKSLSGQATALVEQVVKLRDGEDAALRYRLTMQLAGAEAELFAQKIQIPPETRAQWDALIQRILELSQTARDTEQHLERLKEFDADKLREAMDQLQGLDRLAEISREVSDAFLTDRQRELMAAQRWGDGIRRALEEVLADAPMLADQVGGLLAQLPEAIKEMDLQRQTDEIHDLFRGLADGVTTSLNGVIQGTQTLDDAISHLARNLLLGLGNRLITAGIDAITQALARMAAEALRASGGTGGGGILGLIASLLGKAAGALLSGSAPTEAPVDVMLAKGGIIPGGFSPLSALGFRLGRQLSAPLALAKGGVLAGGFAPLHGFSEPAVDLSMPTITAQVVAHLAGLPFRAMQAGGIASAPMFGLIGEGQFAEAVVPLPDNRSIPVRFEGPPQGRAQTPAPQVHVEILGHVIPQIPTMTPADVVRVVLENVSQDGPIRRAIQQQGRR